ncbi:MBL fold metallo-hydrolase [Dactylosporangium sp. NBC_01737]|uniref:MBL fold metallo-hydrolase n=1 Tax=Dactylosporangium sp. NBC_01737 TaxID=2975959 RepID=UPI002E10C47A|nr:MBL fold metallo-hydrolase [Dactylosporangium sp. NBC_01737]
MKVGDLDVVGVPDGIGHVRPTELYLAGGKRPEELGKGGRDEDWAEHRDLCLPDGRLEMPVGTFLIRTGERVLLVDAGYGPQAPASVSGTRLMDNLASASVGPQDVTDVVLTHLHMDHIGWSAVDGVATFPNAVYRCHTADWRYFVETSGTQDARYREVAAATLAPIADRFTTWSGDETLAPGVDAVVAAGHTPGCTTVVLSSRGERTVLIGDVVHHPVQLLDDAWARVVDVDEQQARDTQVRLVNEFIRDGTPVVGAHFPGLRPGRIVVDGSGRRQWAHSA